MNSDYNDKKGNSFLRLLASFRYAVQGIQHAFLMERNMKIHIVVTIVVLLFGWWLQLDTVEWIFILFAIAGVISLELVNTAIERVVDLASPDYHLLAKQAKDMAAGAVFIYSLLAIAVGIIIFLPKLILMLN